MKMLFIMCESGVDERVMQILVDIGHPTYTRWSGATGNGLGHGRREGTPVWPGATSILLAAVPESAIAGLLAGIEKLRTERSGNLVAKVFAAGVEVLL